eukprot:4696141-Karenia_brevis.AAC.1
MALRAVLVSTKNRPKVHDHLAVLVSTKEPTKGTYPCLLCWSQLRTDQGYVAMVAVLVSTNNRPKVHAPACCAGIN